MAGPEMAASVVRAANGFYADATYPDDYLNKSGANGYLDQGLVFGVSQAPGSQLDIDGNRVLTPAKIFGGVVDLAGFTAGDTVDLQINGETVSITVPTPVTLTGLASAINAHKASTKAIAETKTDGKLVLKAEYEREGPSASESNTTSIKLGGASGGA